MLVELNKVSKRYGDMLALNNIDLEVDKGEIIGFFGPNGAGKTTLLRAILGLSIVEGDIRVNGKNPQYQATKLMEEVSFIADTAILPRWMRVVHCLELTEKLHPRFDRKVAESYLQKTKIQPKQKVSQLSKGMVTQLHLALVMAIDSSLLVLDEPTLGLDIVYRKNFYRDLLDNYFDKDKTIFITTHQIEEIEDLLTRIVFINNGKIILDLRVDQIAENFLELKVARGHEKIINDLTPMYCESGLEGSTYWFASGDREKFSEFGEVKTPRLADLFVARVMEVEGEAEVTV